MAGKCQTHRGGPIGTDQDVADNPARVPPPAKGSTINPNRSSFFRTPAAAPFHGNTKVPKRSQAMKKGTVHALSIHQQIVLEITMAWSAITWALKLAAKGGPASLGKTGKLLIGIFGIPSP